MKLGGCVVFSFWLLATICRAGLKAPGHDVLSNEEGEIEAKKLQHLAKEINKVKHLLRELHQGKTVGGRASQAARSVSW